jgi:hypothetical protein
MTRSPEINELAAALAHAQSEMGTAARDGTNPHFGNAYATLASVLSACRAPLTRHQLSLVQSPRLVSAGDGLWIVELETMLVHASGQFLADVVAVPVAQITAQSLGSCVTYLRRYSALSFTGLAPASDDDDGEAATAPTSAPRTKGKKATAAPPVHDYVIGRVASVARRVLSSGKEKYIVKLHGEPREFESWSATTATAVKDAKEHDHDVELTFKSGKWGLEIVQVRDPSQPEPPL